MINQKQVNQLIIRCQTFSDFRDNMLFSTNEGNFFVTVDFWYSTKLYVE